MPPLLWVFWAAIGLGSLSSLTDNGPPWAVDRTAHSGGSLPDPAPMTWLSSHSVQLARGGVCRATMFAVSGANRKMRLQIDGIEQNLDTSWSYDLTIKEGERKDVIVRYLDPIGGAEIASHAVGFRCVSVLSEEGM